MCDCLEQAEIKANKHFYDKVNKIKNASIYQRAEFTQKGLLFAGGGWQLYAIVEGKYKIGNKNNRYTASFSFNFCPFCGESLTDKNQTNAI